MSYSIKTLNEESYFSIKSKHLFFERSGVCKIWVKVYKRGGNAHSAPLPRPHRDEKFVYERCVYRTYVAYVRTLVAYIIQSYKHVK